MALEAVKNIYPSLNLNRAFHWESVLRRRLKPRNVPHGSLLALLQRVTSSMLIGAVRTHHVCLYGDHTALCMTTDSLNDRTDHMRAGFHCIRARSWVLVFYFFQDLSACAANLWSDSPFLNLMTACRFINIKSSPPLCPTYHLGQNL